MITFRDSSTAHPVGIFMAFHKKNCKYVYIDKNADKEYNKDEHKQLMKYETGKASLKAPTYYSMLKAPGKGAFYPFFPVKENEENSRVVHYVFGKSGSGKSYLSKVLTKLYMAMGLKPIIITPVNNHGFKGTTCKIDDLVEVSQKEDENDLLKEYNKAKIRYKFRKPYMSEEEQLHMELLLMDLKPKTRKARTIFELTPKCRNILKKPTLFVFDDNEAADDVPKIQFLQRKLLLTGRHQNAYMIIISHKGSDYSNTRDVILEAHTYTVFKPWNYQTEQFLKTYLSYNARQRNLVKDLMRDNRYVTIYKEENVIMAQHKCFSV